MLEYLKLMMQLLLVPVRGWEDVSSASPDPDEMLRKGLYPLMGVAALSEFVSFFYVRELSLATVLVRAVVDFGAYFVSLFITRLIFDVYLARELEGGEVNRRKSETLTVFAIGIMVLFRIIGNCLPAVVNIFKFLPLYLVLILYKSIPYMGVRHDREFAFLGLTSIATVLVPLAIYYLLYFIVA